MLGGAAGSAAFTDGYGGLASVVPMLDTSGQLDGDAAVGAWRSHLSYHERGLLVRLDANGAYLWSRSYGTAYGNTTLSSILPGTEFDGTPAGFWLLGTSNAFGATTSTDVYVARTDDFGEVP